MLDCACNNTADDEFYMADFGLMANFVSLKNYWSYGHSSVKLT